jgi:hypothetical protein
MGIVAWVLDCCRGCSPATLAVAFLGARLKRGRIGVDEPQLVHHPGGAI